MKLKHCPVCESDNLGDRWVKGRKLQQGCIECSWKGEHRTPEIKSIRAIKKVSPFQFSGFHYEMFDRYGHIMTHSRSYNTEIEAETAINKEMQRSKHDKDAGPYTAILWPDVVTVKGKVFNQYSQGDQAMLKEVQKYFR